MFGYLISLSLFLPLFIGVNSFYGKIFRAIFLIPTFYLFWLTTSLIYLDGSAYSEETLNHTFETGAWYKSGFCWRRDA